jgi:hypothetical protein
VLILARGKAEYFSKEGWTADLPASPSGKSVNCRSAREAPRRRFLILATADELIDVGRCDNWKRKDGQKDNQPGHAFDQPS